MRWTRLAAVVASCCSKGTPNGEWSASLWTISNHCRRDSLANLWFLSLLMCRGVPKTLTESYLFTVHEWVAQFLCEMNQMKEKRWRFIVLKRRPDRFRISHNVQLQSFTHLKPLELVKNKKFGQNSRNLLLGVPFNVESKNNIRFSLQIDFHPENYQTIINLPESEPKSIYSENLISYIWYRSCTLWPNRNLSGRRLSRINCQRFSFDAFRIRTGPLTCSKQILLGQNFCDWPV